MSTAATSRAARSQIAPHNATLRARLLRYIASCGNAGATDLQAQAALAMDGSTERPRRGELVELGMLVDSGVTRPTASGRQAVVWVASISGYAFSGESL